MKNLSLILFFLALTFSINAQRDYKYIPHESDNHQIAVHPLYYLLTGVIFYGGFLLYFAYVERKPKR